MAYVWVLLGIILLTIGGEALIRGALGTARRLNVSALLCGIVIVGFGTSAPELAVSLDASLSGNPGIAIGNVVGSNIGNILLILGLCAAILPLTIHIKALKRDATVALVSTILCCVLVYFDYLNFMGGLVFLACLLSYLVWVFLTEREKNIPSAVMHKNEAEEVQQVPKNLFILLSLVILGLALMIYGSSVLLKGALMIAATMGISESTVGLTIVAVGTSLPELSISLIAVLRKHGDIAIGNILGSNIFNNLGILGVCALVQPLETPHRIMTFDLWVMLASAILLIVLLWKARKLQRGSGFFLLVLYVIYVIVGLKSFS